MQRDVAPQSSAPPVTVHLDLDGAREIYEGHGWGYSHSDDPIFESGLRNFLEFFAHNGVRATLFVVARSVHDPHRRALLESAVAQGHEIASHSLSHRYLTRIDAAGQREEIGKSRQVLEQALGVPVHGFRAPGYRIDRASLAIVAESGYLYDSSAFPTRHHAVALQSSVARLRHPHCPFAGAELVEWPMPDHRPFPLPFNPSYALLLGQWLFRSGVERFRRGGRPLALLFHLIDLADPLEARRLVGLSSRIFTLSTLSAERKRERCQAMMDQVRGRFRFLPTLDAIAEWQATEGSAVPAGSTAGPAVARGVAG